MEFAITKEDLLACIDKCSLALPDPKHPTEAFRVMTVDASKKKTVRFAAVGEFCTVDTVAQAEIKTSGIFQVIPKHLRDVTGSMPSGRIQVSLKGTRVTMKSLVSSRKTTFENHQIEMFKVDDPGKEAPWITVNARELGRALRIAKAAYHPWENRPDVALLIPTERGLDVFGSNGQMIALVQTNLRVEGSNNIELTGPVIESLFKMMEDDDNISIFADLRRVYLENCDTLVSGSLPIDYPFRSNYAHAINNMQNSDRAEGPVFDPKLLLQGVKGVLAAGGFASEDERKKGMAIDLTLGPDTICVDLKVGDADARDEFDCIRPGAELKSRVDADKLLKILGSMDTSEVQAFTSDFVLTLQSQGITCAIAGRSA